ncbi:hypothetical protein [Pendulispora albinea]|uniref:PBP domain-containing protein n=1 Tax=Pendulispora albinea TaxID=2741071 RepID=A0ABZ2LPS3_9BACT
MKRTNETVRARSSGPCHARAALAPARTFVVSALTAVGVLSAARSSAAADPVACSTLTENPIVIESGDTQEPLLKSLGRKLREFTAAPMTVIYKTTGTCAVATDLYGSKKIPSGTILKYMTAGSDVPLECSVDAAGGLPIDLGIGATFISSCNLQKPDTVGLITGPVQGYGFAVPKNSPQDAITAEEGYFAFGNFGAQGNAQPWVDKEQRFVRGPTKSTALTLAAAIGIAPVTKLIGWDLSVDPTVRDSSAGVLNALISTPSPEKAIGLLGTEIFDANRDKVKLLAFRAAKQRYAYYPDSTPTSFDKRNLRDGHYFPWSPTVYIAPVAPGGDPAQPVPSKAVTKRFVELVLGHTPATDLDGLSVVVSKGLVPNCAMKVTRPADGAPLSTFEHPEPCGCYYEAKVPNGSTSCKACDGSDNACNGGKCRHGYCEAR